MKDIYQQTGIQPEVFNDICNGQGDDFVKWLKGAEVEHKVNLHVYRNDGKSVSLTDVEQFVFVSYFEMVYDINFKNQEISANKLFGLNKATVINDRRKYYG